jgi:protein-disulfide isomerase
VVQPRASIFANPLFSLIGVVAAEGTAAEVTAAEVTAAEVTAAEGTTDAAANPDKARDAGKKAVKSAPRLVPVSGGKKQLNVQQWPVWGNADGKYIVVKMFDYTCSHCRSTHRTMKQAYDQLGGDFGVLALPVPLHRSCNDAATNNSADGADACEVARLAITVWLVDRSKFTGYHDWLFEQKRTAWDARRYAESIVGADALKTELAKGIASKYVSKNVMLYKEAGAGTVPKIVFPTTTLTGEIGSASTVVEFAKRRSSR